MFALTLGYRVDGDLVDAILISSPNRTEGKIDRLPPFVELFRHMRTGSRWTQCRTFGQVREVVWQQLV